MCTHRATQPLAALPQVESERGGSEEDEDEDEVLGTPRKGRRSGEKARQEKQIWRK
eukprot:COSAG01_NODE_2866_length_6949_cov_4.994599_3_plen_56_part_00